MNSCLKLSVCCFSIFDLKDLGEAFYVLGIQILRDRTNGVLELPQKTYIDRVLSRFHMQFCSPGKAPIVIGDVFSKSQCPQSDNERIQMQAIPYALVVDSLIYAQVCTQPDIAYVVCVLGRYLSDSSLSHWTVAKKVLKYLKGTKDFMLTYRQSNILDLLGYCNADFAGCSDDSRSTSGYFL
jgi:hypothetical protein